MGRAYHQEGNKNIKNSPDKLNKTKIFDKKKYRETKYSNQHKSKLWLCSLHLFVYFNKL